MKNKFLAVFMTVAMLLSSLVMVVPIGAETAPEIVVSQASGKAGETVDVTISVANNPGIISLLTNLSYNSDVLEIAKVTDARILEHRHTPIILSLIPTSLAGVTIQPQKILHSMDFLRQ